MSTNIDAFLKDPLSISEDQMNALLAEQDGESVSAVEDSVEVEGEAEGEVEAKQDGEKGGTPATSQTKPEGEPQGAKVDEIDPSKAEVLTRDGKHTIPYSVLESERSGRKAAEQLAMQERAQRELLARQLEELQRQSKETPTQTAAREAPAVGEVISDEQLNALKDEAPELAKLFEGLIGQISAANERAARAEEQARKVNDDLAARRMSEQERMVEDAIGSNPKLLWVRAEKPEIFDEIVKVDDFFRQQPQAAGLTLSQRLAKSVAMYEAANAPIEVPGFAKAVTSQIGVKDAAPQQRGPSTLSDLPGGSIPPRSEADAIKDMDVNSLTQRFMEMSEKQMGDLLARLDL